MGMMGSMAGAPSLPSGSERQNAVSPTEHNDHVHKQQRWLLFLRHCAKCNRPNQGDNQCQYGQSCMVAKQLWRHILNCADPHCSYPRWAVVPPGPGRCEAR